MSVLGQRLRAQAHIFSLFGIGVGAAIIVVILYNTLIHAQTPISQQEIDDSIIAAMASATAPAAYSAQVYQIILLSLVFIQFKGVESQEEEGVGFGGNFGGGGFGGGIRRFLLIDEPTLQAIADTTGGEYYRAEDAEQLLDVFLNLPTQIVLQEEHLEISVFFAIFGAILGITAVGLSLWWNRYP